MTEQQDPRREQYERARRAFEDLKFEDRAFFLVQESISTIVRGIEAAGRALADEFDAVFRTLEAEVVEAEAEAEAQEAEEKAARAEQKTTRARAGKTAAKKTRAKRASSRKNEDKGGDAA